MKICMLTTIYPRFKNDSRGLMVYEFCKNLAKENFDIKVIVPADPETKFEQFTKNVEVKRFYYFFPRKLQRLTYRSGVPANLRKSLLAKLQVLFFAIAFLFKTLKEVKDCGLIHAQWTEPGLIALCAKIITKKPVFITVRKINNNGFWKIINKIVLSNADHVFFNSTFTKDSALKITKMKSYSVLYNSLDIKKFRPGLKSSLKKDLRLNNKKILFAMGLLVEKKGFGYLIKAMKDIVKADKDIVLLIAGHGILESELKQLTNKLNLSKNVIFLGNVSADKTPYYFNIADVFVLPSIVDSKGETETFGVVAIESLACSTPVVASDVGGTRDSVGDNNFLVPQKNPKEIARKVLELIKNKKLMEKAGREGRKYVEQNFSWEAIREKLLPIYKKFEKY